MVMENTGSALKYSNLVEVVTFWAFYLCYWLKSHARSFLEDFLTDFLDRFFEFFFPVEPLGPILGELLE